MAAFVAGSLYHDIGLSLLFLQQEGRCPKVGVGGGRDFLDFY